MVKVANFMNKQFDSHSNTKNHKLSLEVLKTQPSTSQQICKQIVSSFTPPSREPTLIDVAQLHDFHRTQLSMANFARGRIIIRQGKALWLMMADADDDVLCCQLPSSARLLPPPPPEWHNNIQTSEWVDNKFSVGWVRVVLCGWWDALPLFFYMFAGVIFQPLFLSTLWFGCCRGVQK